MNKGQAFDIDIVYTWVDGNDPVWQAKHDAFSGVKTKSDANCKGRYTNNDELKYSLRSIDQYAPWIRKIFIVTDNQVPEWLDTTNPKIQIVDHSEILPSEALPCFNSTVIEHFLYMIPGLSEHFLYSNDDCFINRPVKPSDFFADDGYPIIRIKRCLSKQLTFFLKEKILRRPLSSYNQTIRYSMRLAKERYGISFSDKPHHNIDSYLKSDYELTATDFNREIGSTINHHLRNPTDVQRLLYSIAALARKHGHINYVGRDTSFRIPLEKHGRYKTMEKHNPLLFCMNDSQKVSYNDREIAKEFMRKRFPMKSQFEK